MYSQDDTATHEVDVVVVGGGVSGMSAAFYLFKHDPFLDVVVLEAKPRIGGRTLSVPVQTSNALRMFDVGGSFINFTQQNLLELLAELGIKIAEAPVRSGYTIINLPDKMVKDLPMTFGFMSPEDKLEMLDFMRTFNSVCKQTGPGNLESIESNVDLDLTTMEWFLEEKVKSVTVRNFLRHVIRISCGVEASQISVLFYLALCNSTGGIENQFLMEKLMWIQGGADLICDKIAHKIGRSNVKIAEPVIHIQTTKTDTVVETIYNQFRCKHVILAIPPNEILDIDFDPSLQYRHKHALESTLEGHLLKFIVTYERPFWQDKGFSGYVINCSRTGFIHSCYNVTTREQPALTGYIAADDYPDSNTFRDDILQELCEYFGEEALHPIEYVEKSWLEEPYTYYCKINPSLGIMEKIDDLRVPKGRLFWAGTETATQWKGFIAGAVQAGYRAAMEVLFECRPQTLSAKDIDAIKRKPDPLSFRRILIDYGSDWKISLPCISILLLVGYTFRSGYYPHSKQTYEL